MTLDQAFPYSQEQDGPASISMRSADYVIVPAPAGTRLLFVNSTGDDVRRGSHVFAFAIDPLSKDFFAITSGGWALLHVAVDEWTLQLLMPGGCVQTKDQLHADVIAFKDAMKLDRVRSL